MKGIMPPSLTGIAIPGGFTFLRRETCFSIHLALPVTKLISMLTGTYQGARTITFPPGWTYSATVRLDDLKISTSVSPEGREMVLLPMTVSIWNYHVYSVPEGKDGCDAAL